MYPLKLAQKGHQSNQVFPTSLFWPQGTPLCWFVGQSYTWKRIMRPFLDITHRAFIKGPKQIFLYWGPPQGHSKYPLYPIIHSGIGGNSDHTLYISIIYYNYQKKNYNIWKFVQSWQIKTYPSFLKLKVEYFLSPLMHPVEGQPMA